METLAFTQVSIATTTVPKDAILKHVEEHPNFSSVVTHNIGRNFSHTPHGPTQAPPQITMAQHTCVVLPVY